MTNADLDLIARLELVKRSLPNIAGCTEEGAGKSQAEVIGEAQDAIAAAEETIARLREALRGLMPQRLDWKEEGGGTVLVSHGRQELRAARDALALTEGT